MERKLCHREYLKRLVYNMYKLHSSYIIGMNVYGSTYENWCMVNGMCATAVDKYTTCVFIMWYI